MKKLIFKWLLRSVLTVSLSAGVCFGASAQRTSYHESFIDFGYSSSYFAQPVSDLTNGLRVAYGMYEMETFWSITANFNNFHQYVYNNSRWEWFDYSYYALGADWNYRLFGTYSRNFNLYAGGGIFLGYRQYGTFINLLGSGIPDTLYNKDGIAIASVKGDFLYGMRANLQAEYFFTKKIALVLNVSPYVPFSRFLSSDTFHLLTELSLRMNF